MGMDLFSGIDVRKQSVVCPISVIYELINNEYLQVENLFLLIFDKRSFPILAECRFQFSLGIHDNRTPPGHWLI